MRLTTTAAADGPHSWETAQMPWQGGIERFGGLQTLATSPATARAMRVTRTNVATDATATRGLMRTAWSLGREAACHCDDVVTREHRRITLPDLPCGDRREPSDRRPGQPTRVLVNHPVRGMRFRSAASAHVGHLPRSSSRSSWGNQRRRWPAAAVVISPPEARRVIFRGMSGLSPRAWHRAHSFTQWPNSGKCSR